MDAAFVKLVHKVTKGRQRMPAELERECVRKYQETGSKTALQTLIEYHTVYLANLVYTIYPKDGNYHGLTPMDLLSQAILRFIEKLDDFNLEEGKRLTTYYTREVKTTLQRYMLKYDMMVQQGTPLMQQITYKIHKAINEKTMEQGYPARMEDVAEQVAEETNHTVDFIYQSWQYLSSWCHPSADTDTHRTLTGSDVYDDEDADLEADGDLIQLSLDILQEKLELDHEDMQELKQFLQDPEYKLPASMINMLNH
jgi:DNA-directed RNA polymerase specialized sigma subunit